MEEKYDPVSAIHDIAVLLGRNGYLKSEKTCLQIMEELQKIDAARIEIKNEMTPKVENIRVLEHRWYEAGFNQGLQTALDILNGERKERRRPNG